MKYISIDLETTGLNPETCDIIEIGAVVDDLSKPIPYDKLPKFHSYVLPKFATYCGEPYALSMHAALFKRIAKKEPPYTYNSPEQVVRRLRDFFELHEMTKNPVFVGKNFGSFDLPFLKKIPNWWEIDTSYRVLDPTALFLNVKEDQVPPSLAKCLNRAGLASEVKHTAVDDALQVVRLMRRGLLAREPEETQRQEVLQTI